MTDAFDLVGLTVEDRLAVGPDGTWAARRVPEDVATLLRRAAEAGPDRPLVVLGQHVADPDELGAVADELRSAVEDGVRLEGWFAEPAIDGYEGRRGFDAERGLFDAERSPRPHAQLLAELAARGRPPEDFSNAVILDGPA